MCTIYILSGRVFGKNIYEIDCTSNIEDRITNVFTGFPDCNVIHYQSVVEHSNIKKYQDIIINSLYHYKMKKGKNFYQIDLDEAITKINTIIISINYTYEYENKKQINKQKNKLCFS